MKKNIAIITILIISIASSMFILGYAEQKQRKSDEDFWSVYFVAPLSSDDHRFVIDNHSTSDTFHYDITLDGQIITNEDVSVNKNDQLIIAPPEIHSRPFSITITHDGVKQELTKK